MDAPPRSTVPLWVRALVFGVAYYASAVLGQALAFGPSPVEKLWLPSGLFVAILLRNRYRDWPAFIVPSLVAGLAFTIPLGRSPAIAATLWFGNLLEALIGAWIVRRFVDPFPDLSTVREVIGLIVGGALIAPAVSAGLGAWLLHQVGISSPLWQFRLAYWLASAAGVLLMAPAVLTLSPDDRWSRPMVPGRVLETMVFALVFSITLGFAFVDAWNQGARLHHFLVPLVVWAAFRFGVGGVAATNLLIATCASAAGATGMYRLRPIDATPAIQAVGLTSLVATLAATGLVLAAMVGERRRAQAAEHAAHERIRESEATLRSLLDAVTESVMMIDRHGTILTANRTFAARTGLPPDACVGRNAWDLLKSDVIERRRHWHDTVFDTGEARVYEDQRGDRWITHSVSPVIAPDGSVTRLVAFSTDTTERKRAEQLLAESHAELQSLTRRLVSAQETSAHQIASELHDRIGQHLTALNLNLAVIEGQLSPESAARVRERFTDAQHLVTETMAHVRDLLAELRPPLLEEYGVGAALRWQAERMASRTGATIRVETDDRGPRAPAEVETVLFRIAQEALVNAANHARAREICVSIRSSDRDATLTVRDDGVGIDTEKAKGAAGWGLVLMRERADSIGAVCHVRSEPGAGTIVDVTWRAAAAAGHAAEGS